VSLIHYQALCHAACIYYLPSPATGVSGHRSSNSEIVRQTYICGLYARREDSQLEMENTRMEKVQDYKGGQTGQLYSGHWSERRPPRENSSFRWYKE
jgi:hypothetical protein